MPRHSYTHMQEHIHTHSHTHALTSIYTFSYTRTCTLLMYMDFTFAPLRESVERIPLSLESIWGVSPWPSSRVHNCDCLACWTTLVLASVAKLSQLLLYHVYTFFLCHILLYTQLPGVPVTKCHRPGGFNNCLSQVQDQGIGRMASSGPTALFADHITYCLITQLSSVHVHGCPSVQWNCYLRIPQI